MSGQYGKISPSYLQMKLRYDRQLYNKCRALDNNLTQDIFRAFLLYVYITLRLPHKGYIICCPLLMHSFATQKQITVKLGLVNYGQLKEPVLYTSYLLRTTSILSYQNFNYPCFWCESACPLKRVLFIF